jgi:GTP cyclohydrolase III
MTPVEFYQQVIRVVPTYREAYQIHEQVAARILAGETPEEAYQSILAALQSQETV